MKNLRIKSSYLLPVMCAALITQTARAELFSIEVQSEGETYQQSYDNLSDMLDALDFDEVSNYIPAYTDSSAITTVVNFRGVPVVLSSPQNSSDITMSIGAIDVSELFQGSSRDDSMDLLSAWYEGEGDDALTRLLQELAASTPSDPVAGNPTSLMSRTVGNDFDYAMDTGAMSGVELSNAGQSINGNMVSVFARYSNYSADGIESREYSLPLAYTVRFDNSEDRLIIRVPVAYVMYDGSEVYNLGLGIGYGRQMNPQWSLTPALGYSLVGSEDVGSLSQLVSTSLTSSYAIPLAEYELTIGNMLGYYSTLPTEAGDISQNPEISNTVLRNGASLNIPTPRLVADTSVEVFITDTRYFGSELYIDQYNEIGFSFGKDKTVVTEDDGSYVNYIRRVRAGVKYLFSDNSEGYSLNFGYTF